MNFESALKKVVGKVTDWGSDAIELLPNLAVAVIVLLIFLLLARLGRLGIKKIDTRIEGNDAIMRLIGNLVYTVILGLGIFAALSILQLDKTVTSLLAGAGIIGLALGFAFQETAANFLSGVLMAIRKPFRIGDLIETNDFMGYVLEINLRATVIRNFQGQEIIIPNKNVFYNAIKNYTKYQTRRVDLEVGVSYGDDLEKVKKITLEALENLEGLNPNLQTRLWFTGFENSSINFVVAFWLQSTIHSDYLDTRSEAVMAIHRAYAMNNITIPFPIRTLDFGIKGGQKLEEMRMKMMNLNAEKE